MKCPACGGNLDFIIGADGRGTHEYRCYSRGCCARFAAVCTVGARLDAPVDTAPAPEAELVEVRAVLAVAAGETVARGARTVMVRLRAACELAAAAQARYERCAAALAERDGILSGLRQEIPLRYRTLDPGPHEPWAEVRLGLHHLLVTLADMTQDRDSYRSGMAAANERWQQSFARAEKAEAALAALRKRIEEGSVMYLLNTELFEEIDAIDIRLRDDAERVRVLAEPEEVTP